MSLTRSRSALVLLLALAPLGCLETHFYSGRPPGEAARGYEQRWHSSYLFGTTEETRAYPLETLCPAGWAEISVTQDSLTTLLGLVTLFLYTPSRVTIVCARDAGGSGPQRALELYPPTPSLPR